jgi:hypothetical protein
MLRKLTWIEEPHFQGCGCSECAWVFKPSGNSLDEMKEIFERLRDKEFAMSVLNTQGPRRQEAKKRRLPYSSGSRFFSQTRCCSRPSEECIP